MEFLVDNPRLGRALLLLVPAAVWFVLGVSPALTNSGGSIISAKLLPQDQGSLQQQQQQRLGLGDDDVLLERQGAPAGPADGDPASHPARARKACRNYAKGKWVADARRPLYSGNECRRWLSKMWSCRRMERADFSYESYRWQPRGCEMPEFSATRFLQRMRHRTLAFVGDSLGREQFQSMMCIATGGKRGGAEVEDVGRRYGLEKAPTPFSPGGSAYRFPETNTTVLFYWSATLSELEPLTDATGSYALHLDRPAPFLQEHLPTFDALVLNTGHHWNKVRFRRKRWRLYDGGKPVGEANLGHARDAKLYSIARWADAQLARHPRVSVFVRTISPEHFVDGEWNTGGRCDSTVPLSGGSVVSRERSSDLPAERAVNGTRVKLLDVSAISRLRGEGHRPHLEP